MLSEKYLLDYLYKTLPVSDTASVPEAVLMGYVRHALFLRENSPFSRNISEEMFLNFVFYPRINTEDLTDCRRFFYDLLINRIRGLSEEEAILEINRFCCENMTYQTTDDRTQNPLTSYWSGLGRCGEESTFAVTAFRSVGIPARQIYVPYWVHCDDNHAWVEVFCGGKWCFLGACEPEPVLNRGWFTDASSRAPLACYRLFEADDKKYDESDSTELSAEPFYEKRGITGFYNVLSHYAPVCDLNVTVFMKNGSPAKNFPFFIKVVNYAHYEDLVQAVTDENGHYRIQVGRTGLHLEAFSKDGFAMADIVPEGEHSECTLQLKDSLPVDVTVEISQIPPAVSAVNRTVLTEKQQEENTALLMACSTIRNQRIQGYFLPEYEEFAEIERRYLKMAGGNAPEIATFLKALTADDREIGHQLLTCLSEKDFRDITADVLLSHVQASLPFCEYAHFREEILNPRVENEMITDWRTDIRNYFDLNGFSSEMLRTFREDPETLYAFIETEFPEKNARFYPALRMTPGAVLHAGCSDETGRKLLVTAILRTLGVPARLEPLSGCCEYWRDGEYHRIRDTRETDSTVQNSFSVLDLKTQEFQNFHYGRNYSLDRYSEIHECFEELFLQEADAKILQDGVKYVVPAGLYRLLTANRLPNGSLRVRTSYFECKAGEETVVPLELTPASPEEMLSTADLEPFTLKDADGRCHPSDELLKKPVLFIYPDPAKEPTEHILNELLEVREELRYLMDNGTRVILVLRNAIKAHNDPTIQKALLTIPGVEVLYEAAPSDTVMLARKLFQEPGVWPLLVLAGSGHRGYFGSCGYSVGTADLAVKLMKYILKEEKQTVSN